jgi:hypothetical protein
MRTALNRLISAGDMADDGRVITGRAGHHCRGVRRLTTAMMPPPAEPFDPAPLLQARVDGAARVGVQQNHYSVRARYAGRPLDFS